MKKRQDNLRSHCPINYSLELFGDKWSLIVIRDIVYFGKRTYGDFIASNEGIARNVLAQRLTQLVDNGLLTKTPHPTDGRKELYSLTEKGLSLIPILMDMAEWGSTYYADSDAPASWLQLVRDNRERMITLITDTVRAGSAIFVGENNVLSKLAHGGNLPS